MAALEWMVRHGEQLGAALIGCGALACAAPWWALELAAGRPGRLRAPGWLLAAGGALVGGWAAQEALSTLGAWGLSRCVTQEERCAERWPGATLPSWVALATPQRGDFLLHQARRLDAREQALCREPRVRWIEPRELSRLSALHAARGDCEAQGWALYEHGRLGEASSVWSGCNAWLAMRALHERAEWERASDAVDALRIPPAEERRGEAPGEDFPLAIEVHLLAGRPDRAARFAALAWGEQWPTCAQAAMGARRGAADERRAAVEVLRRGVRAGHDPDCAPFFDEHADLDPRLQADPVVRDALAGNPTPRDTLARLEERSIVRVAQQDDGRAEMLRFVAPASGAPLRPLPVGLLLVTEERGPIERQEKRPDGVWLRRAEERAEQLAIYASLAGRHGEAEGWALRAASAGGLRAEQAQGGPVRRGDWLRFVVAVRAGRLDEAAQRVQGEASAQGLLGYLRGEDSGWAVRPGSPWKLGRCAGPCGGGDDRREGWGGLASELRGETFAAFDLLPLRVERLERQQERGPSGGREALLAVALGAPRERYPRGLLDLLVEASREVALRERLGRPADAAEARRRLGRIDARLRDPSLSALLVVLEEQRERAWWAERERALPRPCR